MRTRDVVLAATLAVPTTTLCAAEAAQPAAPVLPAAATNRGSKVWLGRDGEFESFLRTAAIEKVEEIPIGVTKPRRALFAAGGLARAAAVKFLPPGRHSGFWDSYKSEIAAYHLDRLLDLNMVPVTVERRVDGELAAVQLWVEDCRLLSSVDQTKCPSPSDWAKQVCRQRVFDDLIGNIDRNAGNLLIDPEWNLILIDHSRAFAANDMPYAKQETRIDRELFGRLKALEQASLDERLRPWVLSESSIRDLLKRRDRIVARFEMLAREKGDAVVFPW